jgi:type II secretory pathway pseudopilin PulG
MIKRLTSSGETIIEVLIVMLILTSVMATAFVITTHSLNQDQASQERSEAAGYAQSQIELLNSAVGSGVIKSSSIPMTFICFYPSDSSMHVVLSAASIPALCQSGRYGGYISYNPATQAFTETVVWDNATGSGQDNIELVYRPVFLTVGLSSREVMT